MLSICAGIKPEQVDILITNCSIFCPTPSLASMLINKFKFRRDVQSYNLGGMGCSIGVVAIGLVRDMLQVSSGWQGTGHHQAPLCCAAGTAHLCWSVNVNMTLWHWPQALAGWRQEPAYECTNRTNCCSTAYHVHPTVSAAGINQLSPEIGTTRRSAAWQVCLMQM
jgi:hypothetical protein